MRIFEAHYPNGCGHRYEINPTVGGRHAYYRILKDGTLHLLGEASVIDGPNNSGVVSISETESLVKALEAAQPWEEK